MEKIQTAVEWLFEKINDLLIDFSEGNISATLYGIKATEYKYKAKEMEKQQIADAQSHAISNADMTNNRGYFDCDKYYNETYGK